MMITIRLVPEIRNLPTDSLKLGKFTKIYSQILFGLLLSRNLENLEEIDCIWLRLPICFQFQKVGEKETSFALKIPQI